MALLGVTASVQRAGTAGCDRVNTGAGTAGCDRVNTGAGTAGCDLVNTGAGTAGCDRAYCMLALLGVTA